MNHAFKTLQNPVLRAEYILREQGVDLAESEQTLEDPGLLMEVMESREALDDATSQEQVDVIVSETQGPLRLRQSALRLDTGVYRCDERDHAGGRGTVRETTMGRTTDLCHQTAVPAEYPKRRKGMDSFIIGGGRNLEFVLLVFVPDSDGSSVSSVPLVPSPSPNGHLSWAARLDTNASRPELLVEELPSLKSSASRASVRFEQERTKGGYLELPWLPERGQACLVGWNAALLPYYRQAWTINANE